jgi:hypothetical protein
MKLGDWVQAVVKITEADFMGTKLWTHAESGGIGHVIGVIDENCVDVFFERTETGTICFVHEVKRLCSAEEGRDCAQLVSEQAS